MKSHDFGQFLFNSSVLTETQLTEILSIPKRYSQNLTTNALFLRFISIREFFDACKNSGITAEEELDEKFMNFLHSQETEDAKKRDDVTRNFLTPRQLNKVEEFSAESSISLTQTILDEGVLTADRFEKILDEYHRSEIPPVEDAFSKYYDLRRDVEQPDFPLALSAAENFFDFLSETYKTNVIFVPEPDTGENLKFGASVKVVGSMPVVVGMYAEKEIFQRLAFLYNDFVSDIDDAYDAISELLNVFTGHFAVRVATNTGQEEEPEPPRFGTLQGKIGGIKTLTGVGNFFITISKDEIFPG